jgi:putative oxidoreductase
MKKVYLWFVRSCSQLNWAPRLLAQISIGLVFVESGWGKLHSLPKVIEYFESLHIPAAQIQAPMVAGIEFGCGALILVGLATRIAALPLVGTMVVAIITAKAAEFETWTDVFGISEFLMIVILGYLICYGASPLSLDHLIKRKVSSQ